MVLDIEFVDQDALGFRTICDRIGIYRKDDPISDPISTKIE
jgi:hypothetical protein